MWAVSVWVRLGKDVDARCEYIWANFDSLEGGLLVQMCEVTTFIL